MILTVSDDRPLRVHFDADARLAAIPRTNWVKGFFFTRLVQSLGPEFARVEPQLLAPPRLGRYMPFTNYPGVDYSRLLVEAARHQFRHQPLAEGLRRLQRDAVKAFVDSGSGRVTMAFVGSFEEALLKYPSAQRTVLGIDALTSTRMGDKDVLCEFVDYHGWLDCAEIGVIEGLASRFDVTPTIDIEVEPRQYLKGSYRIRW